MEMMRVSFVITVFALFLALVLPSISAQAPAPAPTSDGMSSLRAHTSTHLICLCMGSDLVR